MIIGIEGKNEKKEPKRATMLKAVAILSKNYGIKDAVMFELGVSDGYAWKCKSGEWGIIRFTQKEGKLCKKVKRVITVKQAVYGKKGKLKKEAVTKVIQEKVWAIQVTSNNGKREKL